MPNNEEYIINNNGKRIGKLIINTLLLKNSDLFRRIHKSNNLFQIINN